MSCLRGRGIAALPSNLIQKILILADLEIPEAIGAHACQCKDRRSA